MQETQVWSLGWEDPLGKGNRMAGYSFTSWQIDEEAMEIVTDLILGSSKITADGDRSHEIKRRLLLGRKGYNKLRQCIKNQRHHFTDKGPSSQRYGFSSSVQFSHSVVSDSLWPHESQHARPPCPSPTPGVYSNSCPSSRWCHPAISSSVVPFSSCPQSLPASESVSMSQLFAWGGQRIGVSVSASVLLMNIQDWFPLGWTGWISLQSKGLSNVFSNSKVQKHWFFSTQLSL